MEDASAEFLQIQGRSENDRYTNTGFLEEEPSAPRTVVNKASGLST